MKTKSKALLLALCAMLLVAATVFGTMAYLTDQDTVTNTFTVGNVKIKLDEAKANEDGTLKTGDEAGRTEEGNEYHLLPGHTYNKDPMVTVLKGSEESYIKMTVTVSFASQLDAIFSSDEAKAANFNQTTALQTIFTGYGSSNWIYKGVTKDTGANTRTYEFWYKEKVGKATTDTALDALFDQIVVPGWVTGDQLATLYKTETQTDGTEKVTDQLKIVVNAYAMQADGFDDATAAWAAFATQNPTTP